jgi:hypothetical protein
MENDEKILLALLTSGTIAEAAKKCDLSERTIYRRLADAEFRTEWREARQGMVETATSQLQAGMSEAVQTLIDSLRLGDKYSSDRIRAAKIILENSVKGVDVFDYAARLEQIEDVLKLRESNE